MLALPPPSKQQINNLLEVTYLAGLLNQCRIKIEDTNYNNNTNTKFTKQQN